MNDSVIKGPFIRTSRSFPSEAKVLSAEVNHAYVDIARNINYRVIGFFPTARFIDSGEQWFVNKNQQQNGYRQTYNWNDSTLTIAHGIDFNTVANVVRLFGTFFDGTNWQILPYVDVVAITNQINVKVTSTQIIITKGGGAPSCNQGLVTIEFIANP